MPAAFTIKPNQTWLKIACICVTLGPKFIVSESSSDPAAIQLSISATVKGWGMDTETLPGSCPGNCSI